MKVRVFQQDRLIGDGEIFALDPPMGVAMAKFEASSAYDITRHANVVDGEYVADRGDSLRVELLDGTALKSSALSIQDWPELGECEVHILGVEEPSFESLFADHPDYKAYWGEA